MNASDSAAAEDNDHVSVAVRLRGNLSRTEMATQCAYRVDVPPAAANASSSSEAPGPSPGVSVNVREAGSIDTHTFSFDHVFDDAETQANVYDALLRAEVETAIDDGSNVAVIAYGQTGSGKTYTILGGDAKLSGGGRAKGTGARSPPPQTPPPMADSPNDEAALSPSSGLFHRMLDDILRVRQSLKAAGADCAVALTAVEVYNDTLFDMLKPEKTPLTFRELGEELVLKDPTVIACNSHADAAATYATAMANRATSATNMNDVSSRSHALFFVDVFRRPRACGGSSDDLSFDAVPLFATFSGLRAEQAHSGRTPRGRRAGLVGVQRARFCLVDLAGNEKIKRSGVEGDRFIEATHVNRSLSSLGTVIHCIATGAKHIPFRDSKLTRLLRPTLTGAACRTKVLVTASPVAANDAETLASLRFAARVKDLPLTKLRGSKGATAADAAMAELVQLERQVAEVAGDVAVCEQAFNFRRSQRLNWSTAERRFGLPAPPSRKQAVVDATALERKRLPPRQQSASDAALALKRRIDFAIGLRPAEAPDPSVCGDADALPQVSASARSTVQALKSQLCDTVPALRAQLDVAQQHLSEAEQAVATARNEQASREAFAAKVLLDLGNEERHARRRAADLQRSIRDTHALHVDFCALHDPVSTALKHDADQHRHCVRSWDADEKQLQPLLRLVRDYQDTVSDLTAWQAVGLRSSLSFSPSGVASIFVSTAIDDEEHPQLSPISVLGVDRLDDCGLPRLPQTRDRVATDADEEEGLADSGDGMNTPECGTPLRAGGALSPSVADDVVTTACGAEIDAEGVAEVLRNHLWLRRPSGFNAEDVRRAVTHDDRALVAARLLTNVLHRRTHAPEAQQRQPLARCLSDSPQQLVLWFNLAAPIAAAAGGGEPPSSARRCSAVTSDVFAATARELDQSAPALA